MLDIVQGSRKVNTVQKHGCGPASMEPEGSELSVGKLFLGPGVAQGEGWATLKRSGFSEVDDSAGKV